MPVESSQAYCKPTGLLGILMTFSDCLRLVKATPFLGLVLRGNDQRPGKCSLHCLLAWRQSQELRGVGVGVEGRVEVRYVMMSLAAVSVTVEDVCQTKRRRINT